MRTLGVDPSSSSTGLALTVDRALVDKAVWKPPSGRRTDAERLLHYHRWFYAWLSMREVDMAVVEELAVKRGWRTVRALAHFEATTLLTLEMREIIIVQARAGQARNYVLGMNPNSSKSDVLEEVRRRWPDIRWLPKDRGGEDEADAFVLALAGKRAAELG